MKYKHYIMTGEDYLASRLGQTSSIIGETLHNAHEFCGRLENEKSIKFIKDGKITLDDKAYSDWAILANGRYITKINPALIYTLTNENNSDVIMLNAEPNLEPYRENIRIKSNNEVAGYRRFFFDSILPQEIPDEWPHYTIIRLPALKSIIDNDAIPHRFCVFLKRCIFNRLKMRSYKVGGRVLNLNTESGILLMMNHYFRSAECDGKGINPIQHLGRIYGKVLCDENVEIQEGATIIGPAIISENVIIPSSATVYNSIICPDTKIAANSFIRKRIEGLSFETDENEMQEREFGFETSATSNNYRKWPLFSYARFGKRTCDIIFSLIVLPAFSIIFVIIAAAIKLTSSGPIFFKHKRQGLNGKTFSCLKFRTMIMNADDIQEKLGAKNQVDGPQFKIDNDPRVTIIGRFLRDTHIDELPQFINILLGQMSLIGPRPSPIKENSYCSYWRDARLSVRPGITGLWQLKRTRQSGQDFQEWIYYDTKYVKNLSITEDINIFFSTTLMLMLNFFKHL
jgi:lipopolysaccharide/colanic/teichoic acid biosynthesis glycosyltransferase